MEGEVRRIFVVSMPERHYPSFERSRPPSETFVHVLFQCQNGIIPRSNGRVIHLLEQELNAFQCQNGIIPRSNAQESDSERKQHDMFQCQNGIIPRSNCHAKS